MYNIAMALEVIYQERLHKVYKEVKGHKDYHICAKYDALKGTRAHDKLGGEARGKSMSAQQGKETIAQCIADLKLLPKKAQVQPVMQMYLPQ